MLEFREYELRIQEGAELSRGGRHEEAARLFQSLADDTSFTDMDRAFMYHNAAVSLGQAGVSEETEALFDRGIELERRWCRSTVREGKAKWLERIGRREDAVEIYTELMHEGWLTTGQRRDFEEAVFRTRP